MTLKFAALATAGATVGLLCMDPAFAKGGGGGSGSHFSSHSSSMRSVSTSRMMAHVSSKSDRSIRSLKDNDRGSKNHSERSVSFVRYKGGQSNSHISPVIQAKQLNAPSKVIAPKVTSANIVAKHVDGKGRQYDVNRMRWYDGKGRWWSGKYAWLYIDDTWYYNGSRWYETNGTWACEDDDAPTCVNCDKVRLEANAGQPAGTPASSEPAMAPVSAPKNALTAANTTTADDAETAKSKVAGTASGAINGGAAVKTKTVNTKSTDDKKPVDAKLPGVPIKTIGKTVITAEAGTPVTPGTAPAGQECKKFFPAVDLVVTVPCTQE